MISKTQYTHQDMKRYALRMPLLESKRILDSILKEILWGLERTYRQFSLPSIHRFSPAPVSPPENNAKNPDNEGLVVIIHGLNGSPGLLATFYAEPLEKKAPGKFEIWVPRVFKKGNCSLEEAAEPILQEIRRYIQTNPEKPIQITGHSNGARIAAYLETRLRDENVAIRITSIAGPIFGSDVISLASTTKIGSLFFKKITLKELSTGSSVAKNLISSMKTPVTKGSREFMFYGAYNDMAIPNIDSCFPKIDKNETCQIVFGCAHTEIVRYLSREETEKTLSFLRRNGIGMQAA